MEVRWGRHSRESKLGVSKKEGRSGGDQIIQEISIFKGSQNGMEWEVGLNFFSLLNLENGT